MNELNSLVKELTKESDEVINTIKLNKTYIIELSKNKMIFRIIKIMDDLYYIDMSYIECKGVDSFSKILINLDHQIISYDKILDNVNCVVYDYKDKSLNIYANNNLLDQYIEGFYLNIDGLKDMKKIYFIKTDKMKFDNNTYYINKRPEPIKNYDCVIKFENNHNVKQELKRLNNPHILNKKGELSLGKTREVIKLYYETDKYSKSGLAKKFRCSITVINKTLSMMKNKYIMSNLMFTRNRPLDTNEKNAIVIYKQYREQPNIRSLVQKTYEDNKCNERVYSILRSIVGRSEPTPYARYLLQYSRNTGWL